MRRLVLLLGLAVLAAGVWMMMPSGGSEAVPSDSSFVEEGAGEVSQSVIGSQLADETEATEDAEIDLERGALAVGTNAPAKRLIPVQVTNRETGAPVPRATVFWYEYVNPSTLEPSEQEHYQSILSDWEKQTERYGRQLVADDLGFVTIPVERYVRATSRHGELYGQIEIRPDREIEADEEYRLELERDLTLRVRVVDSLGEPALGVRVGVLPLWEDGSRDMVPYQVGVSEGPGGLLTRPHLQTRLVRWKVEEPYPSSYLLRALIPGSTEGGVVFDGEDPLDDPIVLQLPPTGRVVLRATDRQGVPLPGEVVRNVYLSIDNGPSDQRWGGLANEDGITTFEWVVADKSYLASARIGNQTVLEPFQGPLAEDQEIRVSLSASEDVYILSGRVLDDQREVVRRTGLAITYGYSEGGGGSRTVRTGEDGQFTTYVRMNTRARNPNLARFTIEDRGAAGPPRVYSMVGERPLVPGENDLGDLVLASSPLLAAGRILVDGEVPDEREVSVTIQAVDPASSRAGARGVEQLSVRYPGEGRFEVWGVARSPRYRAWVNSLEHLPVEPIEFSPGADDVLIDLDSGGSLEAVVLLDQEIPTDDLWLRLIPVGGRGLREQVAPGLTIRPQSQDRLYAERMSERGESHRFRWNAVWPGDYRFELMFRGALVPALELRDVSIAGGENRDPRLDAIDLRGTIRKIVVRVVDEEGLPLSESSAQPGVVINDRTPDAQLQGFAVRGGSATIITSEPYLDLLVFARAYRPVELSGIGSDTTVSLQRSPEIVLRVEGGLPKLPDDHTLSVSTHSRPTQRDSRLMIYELGADTMGSWLQPSASGPLSDSGDAPLPVGEDGVYGVSVSLRNDQSRASIRVLGIEPAELDVRAGMNPRVFRIRIPEEELKRAIRALSGR